MSHSLQSGHGSTREDGHEAARTRDDSQAVHCRAPATCGEFVQGAVDGVDFLVNCPIDLYSNATAQPCSMAGLHLRNAGLHGKIAEAVDVAMRTQRGEHGPATELRHTVSVTSEIPRGKGMASSTADITAALEAVCRSCHLELTDEEFATILTTVEPSDCVHFPGISHVNHLSGQLFETLPAPRRMRALIVDCGGEVDTIGFDRDKARAIYRDNQPAIRCALQALKLGLRSGDDRTVATAATLSATLSQQILRKPQFEELLAVAREHGAYGVNCAHSGTVLGVLHDDDEHSADELADAVQRHFGRSVVMQGDYRVIGGGRHV